MTFGEVKETSALLQPSQAVENPELTRKQGEAFAGVLSWWGGAAVADAERAPRRSGTIPNRARCPWRGTRREADVARRAGVAVQVQRAPPVAEN